MLSETKDVFDAISDLCKLSTDLMVLNAIWLDRPLRTTLKYSRRITKGDVVRLSYFGQFGPALVDVDADNNLPATHVILECRGTLYSQFLEITVECLDTHEELIIKL